ncbi:hypothetical protein F4553_000129 [Allocatelliglobosispora scoriae]|uniref:MEDS domain-containing protein n=1 Tax=Allocatelliglobosispora scoriae TaxID=643052 RepID=A0A841BIV8_9ACTN|nr:MEDS domain-containing protein [Allocatelliglobosispora scoriae]MBB5866750.1 hypothetical protein [Allocatelliglobosispora scoriae]
MRRSEFVDAADHRGSHDHVSWAFDTVEGFRAEAARFLADGLAAGKRVVYLAEGADIADLGARGPFAQAVASGAAQVRDLGLYGTGPVDPAAQVRAYARATEQAVADGYSGLRVAANVTPLVRTPVHIGAFARYEHLIDSYAVTAPFSAMCAVDRTALGAQAVAELACMHPLASAGATPLRLHASADPGVDLVLGGEVDLAGYDLLDTALSRADVSGQDVTVDLRGLRYIDHRAVLSLQEHFSGRRLTVRVSGSGIPKLILDLLDLPDIQVVVS